MQEKIQKIIAGMQGIQSGMNETCPIGIISMENWEWTQGVALFALFSYYRKTKDPALLEYLCGWFDRQFQKGLPDKNVNTMCPMLTMAYLYEETGNKDYLPCLEEWADYAVYHMPRAGEGAIQHVVSGHANEGQIWDDTLYMTVLFIAKTGVLLGRQEYVNESIYQFLVHIKYLTDPKTGLLFHGFTFQGRHHFAGALWGRGNSWYTAGLVDYLEIVKLPASVERFLLAALKTQVDALVARQDASGLWHTLLDDPDSYLETSASAAIGYGILKAVRKGYLPAAYKTYGDKALFGVLSMIQEDGTVDGVSYGTPVFERLEDYKKIEVCPMPYGQSMALMLLAEAE